MDPDRFFLTLAEDDDANEPERAPARLKSQVYSALVAQQASTKPLLGLQETRAAGGGLCVFEHVVSTAPIGDHAKTMNPCRVCHARVLAEHMDHAPIYWPNCPYAAFHRP